MRKIPPDDVLAIGPGTPPYDGQRIVTRQLVDAMAVRGRLFEFVDIGVVNTDGKRKYFARLLGAVRRAAASIVRLKWHGGRRVYLSVNAYRGMPITLLLTLLARTLGLRVTLHHHTIDHLLTHRPIMTALARIAGPTATHVTLCQTMKTMLVNQYPAVNDVRLLSNAFVVAATIETGISKDRATGVAPAALPVTQPLRMGHLASLGKIKGSDRVIRIVEALLGRGHNVRLMLGGAFAERSVEALFRRAATRYPDAFVHVGELDAAGKERFYGSIDLYLLTSRQEAQGIVNIEALASGVPVIAAAHCCVTEDIDDTVGSTVIDDEKFETRFTQAVERFIEDAELLEATKARTTTRYAQLLADSRRQLDELLRVL